MPGTRRSNTPVSNTTFFKGFLSHESAAPDSLLSGKVIIVKPLCAGMARRRIYATYSVPAGSRAEWSNWAVLKMFGTEANV